MNLCRLEMMKIRLSAYLWAAAGIFVSLLSLGVIFLFIFQMEKGEAGISEEMELFGNWNGLFALTTALAFAGFSIFAAVAAAKVIVSEYCGKNAVVLLAYPVSRKAVLFVKCLFVCGSTVLFGSVSNILVICIMHVAAQTFGIVPQKNTEYFIVTVFLSSILMGIVCSAVGMISAAFGWKKRSVIAAVVCSLVIVCASANWIAAFPNHITWILLGMCIVFVVIAGFSYYMLADRIEKMEV